MIRDLRRDDREPLEGLLVATAVFTEDEVAIALELIDTVLEKPSQRDYIIRVCEEGGKVAGYYCIGPTPATDGTFDLYWIAVDPELHGAGVGSRLEEHATGLIKERGGRLVVAETSSRAVYAPTRAFYIRRGYAELARIKAYYRSDDDLVVYGKYLVRT